VQRVTAFDRSSRRMRSIVDVEVVKTRHHDLVVRTKRGRQLIALDEVRYQEIKRRPQVKGPDMLVADEGQKSIGINGNVPSKKSSPWVAVEMCVERSSSLIETGNFN
jgi:hypothetical protein